MSGELDDKRLELLKQAVPSAARVAVLWDPTAPALARQFEKLEPAAQALGVELQSVPLSSPTEIDSAVAAAARERADALFLQNNFLTDNYKARIAELALGSGLPTMGGLVDFPAKGGLMAYGANQAELLRRARVLRGQDPQGR